MAGAHDGAAGLQTHYGFHSTASRSRDQPRSASNLPMTAVHCSERLNQLLDLIVDHGQGNRWKRAEAGREGNICRAGVTTARR
jgi:hypothetical protein